MNRPRVILADDHRLLREAFSRLLEPDCEVVGAVSDGLALLAAAPDLQPDIVVLDAHAKPAMDYRMRTATSLAEELFVLQTMGDDRNVAEVYVTGRAMKAKRRKVDAGRVLESTG